MKRINYTYGGGFPLEQHVLDKMQMAYYETLKAFVGYLNISDQGSYILSGCQIVDGNITLGMMYIDGDLCAFAGAQGDALTKILKVTLTENASFENGVSIAVFSDTVAQINNAGLALSEFIRFSPVYDQNYVHTDFNFSEILKNKLDGIAAGAEVNVQADWEATGYNNDALIKNKPDILVPLWKNFSIIGDIQTTDFDKTISFPPLGTNNYMVVYSMVSQSANAPQITGYNIDNDFTVVVFNKTASSFSLGFREFAAIVQNLRVDYMIIPL